MERMERHGIFKLRLCWKKGGQLERPKGRVRDVLFDSLGLVVFTVFKSRAAETVIGVLFTGGGGTCAGQLAVSPSSIPKEGSVSED